MKEGQCFFVEGVRATDNVQNACLCESAALYVHVLQSQLTVVKTQE